jgi:CxxC motif-containing protein
MKQIQELTCIVCPMGCTLRVEMDGREIVDISGNTCPRGEKYARTEMTAPRRVLTTTVRVNGGHLPVLPVRTAGDIPKELLFAAMEQVNGITVDAPVRIGDVICADVCGTGVSLIACREIHAADAQQKTN